MKKVIIVTLVLMPFLVNAQSAKPNNAPKLLLEGSHFSIDSSKLYFIVKDGPNTLMKGDTSGIIHIYGDTINSLKVILKSLHVKLKDETNK